MERGEPHQREVCQRAVELGQPDDPGARAAAKAWLTPPVRRDAA